jgi:GTP cyclohydrolase I
MARRKSPSTRSTIQTARPPSIPAMESAVAAFLEAAGLENDPNVAETPTLVARAWAEDLLDGYHTAPADILRERMATGAPRNGELVVISGLAFQSVCPHHLLPYGGTAHVAYLPGRYLAGFGQIAQLVDCLSHRLVLQEDLAQQIADELHRGLNARCAGVILEATQACLTLRGERKTGAVTLTEAWSGDSASQRELREGLRAALRR